MIADLLLTERKLRVAIRKLDIENNEKYGP